MLPFIMLVLYAHLFNAMKGKSETDVQPGWNTGDIIRIKDRCKFSPSVDEEAYFNHTLDPKYKTITADQRFRIGGCYEDLFVDFVDEPVFLIQVDNYEERDVYIYILRQEMNNFEHVDAKDKHALHHDVEEFTPQMKEYDMWDHSELKYEAEEFIPQILWYNDAWNLNTLNHEIEQFIPQNVHDMNQDKSKNIRQKEENGFFGEKDDVIIILHGFQTHNIYNSVRQMNRKHLYVIKNLNIDGNIYLYGNPKKVHRLHCEMKPDIVIYPKDFDKIKVMIPNILNFTSHKSGYGVYYGDHIINLQKFKQLTDVQVEKFKEYFLYITQKEAVRRKITHEKDITPRRKNYTSYDRRFFKNYSFSQNINGHEGDKVLSNETFDIVLNSSGFRFEHNILPSKPEMNYKADELVSTRKTQRTPRKEKFRFKRTEKAKEIEEEEAERRKQIEREKKFNYEQNILTNKEEINFEAEKFSSEEFDLKEIEESIKKQKPDKDEKRTTDNKDTSIQDKTNRKL